MRKSNWSDLLNAAAISERESVRRLLESAMMNARAVISSMNTTVYEDLRGIIHKNTAHSHKPCRTRSGLSEQEIYLRNTRLSAGHKPVPSAAII